MDITVREARSEDGDALLDLWYEFTDHLSEFDDRYGAKDGADDHWLSYFQNQLVDSKYSAVLLAESDDEFVGVLEVRIVGEHPIFQLERHGQIHGLFVRERARDEGVGRALLEAAAAWLSEDPRGVDFYRVDAIEGDDEAATALSELGLTPVKHTFEGRID
ncbi:GNAT family N-acetyltransferase (plasmid) [Halobaculum sp. CBA1158]|uniref:GNAT family N-acetyltransferase n=1 Tax=Halobaculum sp. CBA1158 TaxID=2904243 RepID=UPI001F25B195|nr:GNAT family N-acetyltransferase [Halobaculum sp. CBA1158]UIP01496.1 GNAT family N-acetyltransferase [Halobaculum sp. CBA1158]